MTDTDQSRTAEPATGDIPGHAANSWRGSLPGIVAALTLAAALAWCGGDTGVMLDGVPVFVWAGMFIFLVQWVMFVHAWVRQTELLFDLTGSLTYIAVVVGAAVLSSAWDARALALVAVVGVWATRLGTFLFRRVRQVGEDRRFRTLKRSFPQFLMTWTLQGAWVYLTAGCALAAITSVSSVALEVTFFLGLALWLLGFTVEVVSDRQKAAFRANPANEGRFINTGLWACSRHPNYFGEIVLWTGVAVMAFPALHGWQVATLVSPLFVLVLLRFISGVPMLERRADKTWGDDPQYQAYKRNTPVLMLRFPR